MRTLPWTLYPKTAHSLARRGLALGLLPLAVVAWGAPSPRTPLPPALAFVRGGDVWLADVRGGHARRLIRNAQHPAWSPDRRSLAFTRSGNLWRAERDGSGERQLTARTERDEADKQSAPAWDPVSGRILFAAPQHARPLNADDAPFVAGKTLFEVGSGARKEANPDVRLGMDDHGAGAAFSENGAPAFSRTGRWLALARNGDVWLARRGGPSSDDETPSHHHPRWDAWQWDLTRLAAVAQFDAPSYRASRENHLVTALSWSPDERHLAYGIRRVNGSGFNEVHVLTLRATNKSVSGFTVAGDRLLSDTGLDPAFSPDGRWVAYRVVSPHPHFWGIEACSVDGKRRRMLVTEGEQPAW